MSILAKAWRAVQPYADIDPGVIVVAKNAADPAGHYSRPDVTCLLINKTRMRRVEAFAIPMNNGQIDEETERQKNKALRYANCRAKGENHGR